MIIIIVTMKHFLDNLNIFQDRNDGKLKLLPKLDGLSASYTPYSESYKSRLPEMLASRTDSQIKRFETEARGNLGKGLRPYTLGKYDELNEIAEPDAEKLIAKYVALKLRNPTPVILWHYPSMVKLATPHMISRIEKILEYEKTKADLYQAIEDLEHSHKRYLEGNEKTIESVLKKGHNLMI